MAERPLLYRGRFAPSPTGPLHFGSRVARARGAEQGPRPQAVGATAGRPQGQQHPGLRHG